MPRTGAEWLFRSTVPLRTLLAAVVVLSNSFLLANGVTDADPWKRFNHQQAILGHTAVDFFFILSGFLIAGSLLAGDSLARFFSHRIRRVYPGFLLAAFVSFVVILPLGGGHLEAPAWLSRHLPSGVAAGFDLIYRSLRLNQPTYAGAFPHNPYPADVNQSIWSIFYGFGCYVLAALASRVRLRRDHVGGLLRTPGLLTIALVLATAVSVWFHVLHVFPSPRWAVATIGYPAMWIRELPMFLGGLTLRSWMVVHPERLRPGTAGSALRVRVGVVAALAILASARIPHGLGAVLPFAGPLLIAALIVRDPHRRRHVARLGDPSYGMYLLSFPVQQLLVAHSVAVGAPWLLFAISGPLSLAAGYLSWHLVERWFVADARRTVQDPAEEWEPQAA